MTAHDPTAPLILFVDDEATAVKYFQRAIDSLAPVVVADTVAEGRRILDQHAQTLLVLVSDQRMPGGYGNELLHYARTRYPHIVRILTTAYSELEHTVEAVNQGQIHRYIQKPWEISALRLELKQALELATLRKEHAQLLREKLMVRQNQTISNRIGTLYTLCVTLGEPDPLAPMESYLAAAASISNPRPAEPDWLLMDYADLVSAEARRSGQFGSAVRDKLAGIKRRYPNFQGADGLDLLAEVLAEKVQISGDEAMFPDAKFFAEFLETPSDAPISAQHVSWLAFLIWLHGTGNTLQLTKQDDGMRGRLIPCAETISQVRMADWIERFCDMPADNGAAPA